MKQARKFLTIIALSVAAASSRAQATKPPAMQPQDWVASWGASQQIPEPQNALPPEDLRDATVRQIFHLSVAGSVLRVHVSNAFGTEALHFISVHIARPVSPATAEIDPATDKALTFAGSGSITVPPGAEYVSDPRAYPVAALSDLAVTFHLDAPPARETGHPGSRATSYYVHGDAVDAARLTDAKHVDHWYQVSEIDVLAAPGGASVVALGDSITDGHGATTNGNDRWTDVLAQRLQGSPETRNIGVSNQGIGGNHLLTDGLGPRTVALRPRCAGPRGCSLGDCFRRRERSGRTCAQRGSDAGGTCGACAARAGGISTDRRTRSCAWAARHWGHGHAVCGLRLLSPRSAQ
jgi:hypothetical protein